MSVGLEKVSCPQCKDTDFIHVATRFDGLDIVRCRKCKLAHVNPRPRPEEIVKMYEQEYYGGEDIKTFGIVYLEANAAGLPVVGSRCGGITEAVEDNVNGILVEPNNPEQTARAILQLLDNPQLCLQYAEAGITRIKTKYNWSSICDQILKQFQIKGNNAE